MRIGDRVPEIAAVLGIDESIVIEAFAQKGLDLASRDTPEVVQAAALILKGWVSVAAATLSATPVGWGLFFWRAFKNAREGGCGDLPPI